MPGVYHRPTGGFPRDPLKRLNMEESADLQEFLEELNSLKLKEGGRYSVRGGMLIRIIGYVNAYAEIYDIGTESTEETEDSEVEVYRRPARERKEQE